VGPTTDKALEFSQCDVERLFCDKPIQFLAGNLVYALAIIRMRCLLIQFKQAEGNI